MNNQKIIKVFEDKRTKLNLNENEKTDILKMNKVLDDKEIVTLDANGYIYIKGYIGFIQVNNTRLVCYPKISFEENCTDYDRAFNIFMRMLFYTKVLKVKKLHLQNLGLYKGDILEVFIHIFSDNLYKIIIKNMNKGYSEISDNQTYIKGKINVLETIKVNHSKKHIHNVLYEDFNENTLLNRVLKKTVRNLILVASEESTIKKLKSIIEWYRDVKDISLSANVWGKVTFNRENSAYKDVFQLAKLFYNNITPNVNCGENKTFGFMIKANALFEKYIYEILKNETTKYDVQFQNPKKYLVKNKQKYKMKPDIVLCDDEVVEYILDTKYKYHKENISDMYQMVAYSIVYSCNKTILLYPKFLDVFEAPITYQVENKGENITIIKLLVDLEKSEFEIANEIMKNVNRD